MISSTTDGAVFGNKSAPHKFLNKKLALLVSGNCKPQ